MKRFIHSGIISAMPMAAMQVYVSIIFCLSPHLKKRLLAAGVDRHVRGWEKSSDHAPVWIELADE